MTSRFHSKAERLVQVRLYRLGEILARLGVETFGREHDIRLTDFRILNILYDHAGIEVAAISRLASIDKAWVARVVSALETRGLVERRPHATDRRRVLVFMTHEGERLLDAILPMGRSYEEQLLVGLDQTEVDRLLKGLEANAARLIADVELR